MTEEYRIERVRLYPTPAQRRRLQNYAGAHRWTWNWALAAREAHGCSAWIWCCARCGAP